MRGHGVLFFCWFWFFFWGKGGGGRGLRQSRSTLDRRKRGKGGCDGVAAHSTGGKGDGGGKTAARRGGLGGKGREGRWEGGQVRGVWVMRWSMTWG